MPTLPVRIAPWQYDPRSRGAKYRNLRTGRFVGPAELVALRNQFALRLHGESDALADRLINREITIQQWTLSMRELINQAYIAQYAAAVGGRNNMSFADYGRIGRMMAGRGETGQYWYLQRFAQAIAEGRLTPNQIRARAQLYMNSSRQAAERGRARQEENPRLPAYPADGSTRCLSNCRCSWEIIDRGLSWDCYWRVNYTAEHCPDCLGRAAMWNPLAILKGVETETLSALMANVGGAAGFRDALVILSYAINTRA